MASLISRTLADRMHLRKKKDHMAEEQIACKAAADAVAASRHGSGARRPRSYHRVTVARDVFEVDRRYVGLKPIGSGSYGMVASATDTVTGQKVAIKKISDMFADLVDAKRILREIKLLRHLDAHENVIAIRDITTMPPDTTDFSDLYIITDLMESDLDRIISSNQPLTEQHFQYFIYQILRGLKYIHSANVLHRDMKPSNLLVNANCDLAICDFGLARGVEVEFFDDLTEYVVTRWYRAPELLAECHNYGRTVDVWALGCIFAELMYRKPFFQGRDPTHQLHVICRVIGTPTEGEMGFITHAAAKRAIREMGHWPKQSLRKYFPTCSTAALDLISRMLVFNPDDRITVDEALAHPYLAQLHNQCDEPECAHGKFNFDFERPSLEAGVDMTKDELQRLLYREMREINTEGAARAF